MPTEPTMTAEQRAEDPSIRLSEPTYRIMELARIESIKPAERFQRIADTIAALIREAERAAVRKCYVVEQLKRGEMERWIVRTVAFDAAEPFPTEEFIYYESPAEAQAYVESEIDRILKQEQG